MMGQFFRVMVGNQGNGGLGKDVVILEKVREGIGVRQNLVEILDVHGFVGTFVIDDIVLPENGGDVQVDGRGVGLPPDQAVDTTGTIGQWEFFLIRQLVSVRIQRDLQGIDHGGVPVNIFLFVHLFLLWLTGNIVA